jgi:hypothetical protein
MLDHLMCSNCLSNHDLVLQTTDPNDTGLAKQGQFRANNLYKLFSPQREAPVDTCYNVPDFIFAMKPGHVRVSPLTLNIVVCGF